MFDGYRTVTNGRRSKAGWFVVRRPQLSVFVRHRQTPPVLLTRSLAMLMNPGNLHTRTLAVHEVSVCHPPERASSTNKNIFPKPGTNKHPAQSGRRASLSTELTRPSTSKCGECAYTAKGCLTYRYSMYRLLALPAGLTLPCTYAKPSRICRNHFRACCSPVPSPSTTIFNRSPPPQ